MNEQPSKNVNPRPGGIEPKYPSRPPSSPFQDRPVQVDDRGGIKKGQ